MMSSPGGKGNFISYRIDKCRHQTRLGGREEVWRRHLCIAILLHCKCWVFCIRQSVWWQTRMLSVFIFMDLPCNEEEEEGAVLTFGDRSAAWPERWNPKKLHSFLRGGRSFCRWVEKVAIYDQKVGEKKCMIGITTLKDLGIYIPWQFDSQASRDTWRLNTLYHLIMHTCAHMYFSAGGRGPRYERATHCTNDESSRVIEDLLENFTFC